MSALDMTVLIAFVVSSIVSFVLMGVDKRRARRGAYRIPERTLLLWCACFGAAGGLLGMRTFRHKTRHKQFSVGIPMLLVVQLALLALYIKANI